MKKAANANKALLLLTLLFIIIAACSFAAFREAETICTEASGKCNDTRSSKRNGGGMFWDDFSRLFVSVVSSY